MQSKFNREIVANAFFYNLLDTADRELGFKKDDSHIRIIPCGGDGSVMFVIDEMIKAECNFDNAVIGIIPLGTGNDFARALGWGGGVSGDLVGASLSILKMFLIDWLNSEIHFFDIWEVEVTVVEKGYLQQVVRNKGKLEKVILKDEYGNKKITIRKPMCNYFSIGCDARVGLGFDKKRTTSQCRNKCIYCWEGFKKAFQKGLRLQKTISSMEENQLMEMIDSRNNMKISISEYSDSQAQNNKPLQNNKGKFSEQKEQVIEQETKTIFLAKSSINSDIKGEQKTQNYLQGNPSIILFQNINSYAGGVTDLWNNCEGRVGIKDKAQKKQLNDTFTAQDFGDGKIEAVTFGSLTTLGFERLFGGQAQRIAQGQGPFILNFKDSDDKGNLIQTYFQVDGEYFQINGPSQFKVFKTCKMADGKIKVMMEQSKYVKFFKLQKKIK